MRGLGSYARLPKLDSYKGRLAHGPEMTIGEAYRPDKAREHLGSTRSKALRILDLNPKLLALLRIAISSGSICVEAR
jgi:hypothetical protein